MSNNNTLINSFDFKPQDIFNLLSKNKKGLNTGFITE
jgi:hypothetical protein